MYVPQKPIFILILALGTVSMSMFPKKRVLVSVYSVFLLLVVSSTVSLADSQSQDTESAIQEEIGGGDSSSEGSKSSRGDEKRGENKSDKSVVPEHAGSETGTVDPESADDGAEAEDGSVKLKKEGSEDQHSTDSDDDKDSYSKDLSSHGVQCTGKGACRVIATDLPLRALPRSFSPLYADADDSVDPISNAVSGFKPMFVFEISNLDDRDATEITGWYQLGYSERRPIGWMKAQDVIEWRQALILEYTHTGVGSNKRSPVVMFSDLAKLENFVTGKGRKTRTEKLLKEIADGKVPDGVIGKEPERFLNIDDDFYLLPVVNWSREESFDDPSHYLQVVAAVPGSRAESRGESTLQDEDYLAEELLSGKAITDIVFVMDMTGSMQPYIDAVKITVGKLVKKLTEGEQDDGAVKFGLVGYRDSIEATPELEWDVKEFTPELLTAADFLDVIRQVEAAKVSSDEWAENVHGGYLAGIKSQWRTVGENRKSIRLMLLIGDASGHDVDDHKRGYKNSSGSTASDLYELARTNGIYPYTIHLKDARAEREWGKAQRQFEDFSYKHLNGDSSSFSTLTEFAEESLSETAEYMGARIKVLIEGGMKALNAYSQADDDPEAPDGSNEEGGKMIELARGVMQAAIADFLGDVAKPPRDFTSWVHDYDLADASREALSVRVMITRRHFDNVIRQTESLIDALSANIVGNVDFLVALKQASARTSLGLKLNFDESFEDQEFLPGWVSALPYKSRILSMSPEEFANFRISERRQFLARLESKLNAYGEIAGAVDRWLKLDENDDSLQEVVALPLTLLP